MLQEGIEDSRLIHMQTLLASNQAIPFWYPKADFGFHANYFNSMAARCAPIRADGPFVAIGQSTIHPDRFPESNGLRIHDLQRGTHTSLQHLNKGYAELKFHEGILHVANSDSLSAFTQNAEVGWIQSSQRIFPAEERRCYLADDGRSLWLNRSTHTCIIYGPDDLPLFSFTDPEVDIGAGDARAIRSHCIHKFGFNGSYVAIPLTDGSLRIYELNPSETPDKQCIRKSTTKPLGLDLHMLRIRGNKMIAVFTNGQARIIDLFTGKFGEFLPLNWDGLEKPWRKIDYMHYLDADKVALTLNTGSVQVFNLRNTPITRHTLNSFTEFTNVTAVDLKDDFLSLGRLFQESGVWSYGTGAQDSACKGL